MNKRRVAILGVATACGVLAFGMVLSASQRPVPPAPTIAAPIPQPQMMPAAPVIVAKSDVLVAAVAIPTGERIRPEQLKWQAWPTDLVPATAIQRGGNPSAIDAFKGTAARVDIAAGEIVSLRKAVRGGDSGYLASIVSPGMRAAAVPLDQRGARSAGGFIAPSDRVDVLLTIVDAKNQSPPTSRTVLENVRVLAIGQQVGDGAVQATAPPANGAPATPSNGGVQRLMADNATLEVTPAQALDLAAAARTGEITLVLRASNDLSESSGDDGRGRRSLKTIIYGNVQVIGP